MLRIDPLETENGESLIRLQGKVIGPWVDEVRKSCELVLTRGERLTLDLSGVSFIDRDGVELFRRLSRRRVTLRNGSGFVMGQLKV